MKKKSRRIWSDLERARTIPGVPDDELPEITAEDFDNAILSFGNIVLPTPRRRGRPAGTGKKVSTTVRFDRDVVASFRAMGRGWQTRMNEALKEWLAAHPVKRKRAARSAMPLSPSRSRRAV